MSSPSCRRRRSPHVLLVIVGLALGFGAAQGEAWTEHPLIDVVTGETFTLSDFAGSVVAVETMATWCANCERQLGHLQEAADVLAGEAAPGVPVTYVVISVERGLAPAVLAAYAARHGFTFRFAIADDVLLRSLAERFGRVALNPPATPHVVIAPDGTVGPLTTGFTAPAALVERLQAAAR